MSSSYPFREASPARPTFTIHDHHVRSLLSSSAWSRAFLNLSSPVTLTPCYPCTLQRKIFLRCCPRGPLPRRIPRPVSLPIPVPLAPRSYPHTLPARQLPCPRITVSVLPCPRMALSTENLPFRSPRRIGPPLVLIPSPQVHRSPVPEHTLRQPSSPRASLTLGEPAAMV